MCRNITTLRGLEPAATPEEIEAAARQFVRKVSGVQSVSAMTEGPLERAVDEVAAIVTRLLSELPARRQPPATVPPLRRPEVRARLEQARGHVHDDEHEHSHPHDHVHDGEQAHDDAHGHGHGHGDPHDHVHV